MHITSNRLGCGCLLPNPFWNPLILISGAILKLNVHNLFILEIGYFVDEKYWGKGVATRALKQLEEFILSNLSLHRIEIRMAKENKASQKIAIKCGYRKEGILHQVLCVENRWHDCYLYSKIV